jgi:hypothetical protein
MDNNYGWQKQQVDERIQCALKNAATCRLSHAGSPGKSFSAVPYKAFFIPVVVVLFLVGFMLSSCITAQPPPVVESISQAVSQSNSPSRLVMADWIRIHDQVREQTHPSRGVKVIQPVESMAMAERIRFQDRVWEQAHPSREVKVIQPLGSMAIAERIRFQDQVWEQMHSSREVKVDQPVVRTGMAGRILFHDRLDK